MRMKDRQRVNESVGGTEAPTVNESQRIRGQILMRQHRAFRAAGGAGRIEDRSKVIARPWRGFELGWRRGDRRSEGSITFDAKTLDRTQVELLRERANGLEPVGTAEGERRFGVAKEIFELGKRVGRVQRQQHRPRPKTSGGDANHVN